MDFNSFTILAMLLAVPAAFVVSSAAGLGGSIILVPALATILGTKEGIAVAALLLAANNMVKIFAYRQSVPLGRALYIAAFVVAGAALGAGLMLQAPESWVAVAVIIAMLTTFLLDVKPQFMLSRGWAGLLALFSGASSGFSGTSGPLKGIAIRSLGLSRDFFVGAAATVSLAGDATKTLVFAKAGLLGSNQLLLVAALIPVMVLSTYSGRFLNQRLGERGFAVLFWLVMLGYATRLVLS